MNPECALLPTPFRFGAACPHGSRYRRAGKTPGVYSAAERQETAAAEMVFYRFRFYAESPATPFPDDAAEYTAFSVDLQTDRSIDLTADPLAQNQGHWTHPTAYVACQSLAVAEERDAGIVDQQVQGPTRTAVPANRITTNPP